MENYDIGSYATEPIKPGAVSDIGEIVRGEISAAEAYRQVISKLVDHANTDLLNKFLTDHEASVEFWQGQLESEGFNPEVDAGFWGKTVEAFVGTAKLFGDHSAILALREGEMYGQALYENFLDREDITLEQRQFIREQLLPLQKQHIKRLEQLAKTLN